jgi:formate/nitrite transporter FocA (FNT family)
MSDDLRATFERTMEEGQQRLHRSWPGLLATGAVGGIDISIGVMALLSVKAKTHSELLSSLFFGVGFICLTMANSELFTENFLVPIAAIAARRATWFDLLRLWIGALVMNLVGGWVMMGIVLSALPGVRPGAVELGTHFAHLGVGWTAFTAAVAGGAVITLMTWMQHSTDSMPAKLVAAVVAAFLLGIGPLNHAIVVSLEMFGGLQAGAPYGYLRWLEVAGWATVGNIVGGVGLVTVMRLIQVGRANVQESARTPHKDDRGDEAGEAQAGQEEGARKKADRRVARKRGNGTTAG